MSFNYDTVDSAYADACSFVTLCSNSKGFFKSLNQELLGIAEKDEWLQKFENVAQEDKIQKFIENKQVMEALTEIMARIEPMYRGKDAKVSQDRRLEAQRAIREDPNKALALASQAVLRAPMAGQNESVDGGVSLALALWVRSEILLKCGKPSAALEDLKLALKERLPAKMRSLYYWRMGHCYRDAGEPTKAKVSYELACRLLGNDEAARTRLNEDVHALDYSMRPKVTESKPNINLTGGAKKNMPALSKLIKITEEENKGRYAITNAPVKTGDILLVDTPYAACLLSDYYGTHCLHCFKRLEDCENEAPVWCPKCSGVAFCSLKCRDVAVSTYHLFECQFLDLFIGSGMSVLTHIALRMVTQAGLDTNLIIHEKYLKNKMKTVEGAVLNDIEGTTKKSRMKSRKERLNRTKNNLKHIDKNGADDNSETKELGKINLQESLELRASQVYSLCSHAEQRKGKDIFSRILMAMFLNFCLKKGGFYKNCINIDNAELSICELIVQNLQLLQFNAHEIYETIRGQHQFNSSKPVYIAVGIYPTGALFNHECYPAVARYFDGRNIILRAIRPLASGETVSENYGPHFMVRNLQERQRSLACRYWFKCECLACKEDWPTMKKMNTNTAIYLRCSNIGCPAKFREDINPLPNMCSKCSTPLDKELFKLKLDIVNKCVEQYQRGAQYMESEQVDKAIDKLCDAINLYHEVAFPPHRDTHVAQEALRSCYAATGNVHVVRGDCISQNK